MNQSVRIIFLCWLLTQTANMIVKKSELCNHCTQLMSFDDCKMFGGCIWSASSSAEGQCRKDISGGQMSLCQTVLNPYLNCHLTFGCAYVEGNCIPFAGCSAYPMQSQIDCYNISYQCVFDGTKCIQAQYCDQYIDGICPEMDIDGRKCVLYDKKCSYQNCGHARPSLDSDFLCDAFSKGCVTIGLGCAELPLQDCSYYGPRNGECTSGANGQCHKTKYVNQFNFQCEGDKYCNEQICKQILNDPTKRDIKCIFANTETDCRTVGCNVKAGKLDQICREFHKDCITNGNFCTKQILKCSEYIGTIQTCAGYIGTDGMCKGISTFDQPCVIKDCVADSNPSIQSDGYCQLYINPTCKSTGKGCVNKLEPCATYSSNLSDASDCLSYIGSDGKCKTGSNGKCVPRVCTEAPSSSNMSNDYCAEYSPICASNQLGCVAQTSCENTQQPYTCLGTTEGDKPCHWIGICISNQTCSQFTLVTLCNQYKSASGNQCIWENNSCREVTVQDLIGNQYLTDEACNQAHFGYVTNGRGCVDPKNCSSFFGNKETCLNFKAYCTNKESANSSDSCIDRFCSDSGLNFTTDEDCEKYLPGCLTNGKGCISNTEPCSSYDSAMGCNRFFAYFDGQVKGAKCFEQNHICVESYCELLNGKNNSECDSLLSGCLNDGQIGCLDPSAPCSSYYGTYTTCSNFKGSSGKISCYYDSQSQKCRDRICTDNTSAKTNADCNKFLAGCITNNKGCIDQNFDCNSDNAACNMNPQKCAKISNCKPRVCSDYKEAVNNKDCLKYNSKCRLVSLGSKICQDAQISCNSYNFAQSYNENDKQIYCNSISTSSGVFCAYNIQSSNNCVNRTDCSQWKSILDSVNCNDYLGTNTCQYQQNNDICFKLDSCETYEIPKSFINSSEKLIWCQNMLDTSNQQCGFNEAIISANCVSTKLKCENVQSPPNASFCNSLVKDGNCLWSNNKCYTNQLKCTDYIVTSIPVDKQSEFCGNMHQKNQLQCKFDSNISKLTCASITCVDIVNPQSQSDCDSEVTYLRCTYYPGTGHCHDLLPCEEYQIPVELTSEEDKMFFCQNMEKSLVGLTIQFFVDLEFCSYEEGSQKCSPPVDQCTSYSIPSTVTDKDAYCSIRRNSRRKKCFYSTKASDLSKCSEVQIFQCSEIKSLIPFKFNWECDLRSYTNLCQVQNGICVSKPNKVITCVSISADGSFTQDKKQNCFSQNCYYRSGDFCVNLPGYRECELIDGLDATIDNTIFCSQFKIIPYAAKRRGCGYIKGATNCANLIPCEKHPSPQSQDDCDVFADRIEPYFPGCFYFKNKCIQQEQLCKYYKAIGDSDLEKFNYCPLMKEFNLKPCTYTIANKENCSSHQQKICEDYDVQEQNNQLNYCQQFDGCTYWEVNPKSCISIGNCETYKSDHFLSFSECNLLKDSEGNQCGNTFESKICSKYIDLANQISQCANIINPIQQSDCGQSSLQCQYYNNKCYLGSECQYATNQINVISFCSSLRNSKTGELCTALSNSDANCINRQCSDKKYPTHSSCQQYKSTCKSDGMKCIEGSIICDNQKGTQQYCQWVLDSDNVSPCTSNLENTKSAVCASKTCYQNVTSTTDVECETYLSGCVTKGTGCIPKTEPCSSYYGGIEQCKNFIGNGFKCWGISNTVSLSSCKIRMCSDITTPKSQQDCQSFLEECHYNGDGKCLHSSLSCFYYKGNIQTCQNYKGVNGTVLCWGNNNNVDLCRDRLCTDFNGTDDASCQRFLPAADGQPPRCVTNGKFCVSYPRNCNEFQGTEDECSKFTAKDGPCQGDPDSNAPSTCMPRNCLYAPNSLITDAECKIYHPLCVTTGRGCTIQGSGCTFLQGDTPCQARPGCLFVQYCTKSVNTCAELTIFGLSYCANSPTADRIKCIWRDNSCKNFSCADYSNNIQTHLQCYQIDHNCTTNGKGCMKIGNCNMYKKESICTAANTNEPQIRCTWDVKTGRCRKRQCTDLQAIDEQSCKQFLAGCTTNGFSCIGPHYSCSEILNSSNCLKDSDGYPCLYVNGVCIKFARCEDAQKDYCTSASKYCTQDGDRCISKRPCNQYSTPDSCLFGIYDERCEWNDIDLKCELRKDNSCNISKIQYDCELPNKDASCVWKQQLNICKNLECEDIDQEQECLKKYDCFYNESCNTKAIFCSDYEKKSDCQIAMDGTICFSLDNLQCREKVCFDLDNEECSNQTILLKGQVCRIEQDTFGSYFCKGYVPYQCGDFANPTLCEKYLACYWEKGVCLDKNSCSIQTEACRPFVSFDGEQYTLCNLETNNCIQPYTVDKFNRTTCFIQSAKTYTWNTETQKCVACLTTHSEIHSDNIHNIDTKSPKKMQRQVLKFIFNLLILALWTI